MKIRQLYIVLGLFFLVSCEKLITELPESRLPNIEKKLVLFSFISPQDSIHKVFVTLSKPIFTNTDPAILIPIVENGDTLLFTERGLITADVTLSDGTKDIKLNYNTKENFYTVVNDRRNPFVSSGKTIKLTVKANGLTATSETTVPKGFPDLIIKSFNTKKNTGFSTDYESTLKLFVDDKTDPLNYALFASTLVLDSTNNLDSKGIKTGTFKTSINEYRIFFDEFRSFSSKEYKLPQNITASGNYRGGNDPKHPYFMSLHVELRKTDTHYQEFENSRRSNTSGNPFVEPTPLYSNVKGGLGVFGSFVVNRQVIKAEKGRLEYSLLELF